MKINSSIDIKAASAAACFYIFLNLVWYSRLLFFGEWAAQACLILAPWQEAKVTPLSAAGLAVSAMAAAFGIELLMGFANKKGARSGAVAGLLVAALFVLPALSREWYAQDKLKLFIIDGSFQLIAMAGMGAVIGLMRRQN